MGLFDNLYDFFISKGLTRTTSSLYIQKLKSLAGFTPGKVIKSLKFLNDIDEIDSKIRDFSNSTKIVYLSAVVNALRMNSKTSKKLLSSYEKMINDLAEENNKKDVNVKTKTQEENWTSWDEIIKKRDELKDDFEKITSEYANKRLSPSQYQKVQDYVILSLYTFIPPRRNQDYMNMVIVKSLPDKEEDELNYYIQDKKQFIFNNYKTAKTYGKKVVDVPDTLADILDKYAKVIPGKTIKFIISKNDGSQLTYTNTITRIMNRIFKKKISSSMLRHIYLSSKYDIEDMKEDAEIMGHSLEQQKHYLKKKSSPDKDEDEEEKEEEEEEEEDENEKKGSSRLRNLRVRDDRIIIPEL
jgi:hypothetical protein